MKQKRGWRCRQREREGWCEERGLPGWCVTSKAREEERFGSERSDDRRKRGGVMGRGDSERTPWS
eukprot:508029-Rhodomonas_salina.2